MKHDFENSQRHQHDAGNRHHNTDAATNAERNILHSLRQSPNNANSEIIKELNQLRDADRLGGKDFSKDLQNLNKQLNQDLAKLHLPQITITENGKDFQIKPADAQAQAQASAQTKSEAQHSFHQLPHAVQHAIRHNAHRHFRHGAGRFVAPEHGGPDGGSNPIGPDGKPLPEGKPVDTTEASPSKSGFSEKLLNKLGMPVTKSNLAFLDAWQKAEGGSADNPFNTTQNAPGAHRFNSVGVKRYPSVDVGVDATAKTLTNGHYNEILSALKNGDNAHTAAVAVSRTPWGTGRGVARLI
jgi:hypothetical protein